ncbi:MAG: hypothetical protein AMXMBFR53_14010 [Gemmatimonadota bacterium]
MVAPRRSEEEHEGEGLGPGGRHGISVSDLNPAGPPEGTGRFFSSSYPPAQQGFGSLSFLSGWEPGTGMLGFV